MERPDLPDRRVLSCLDSESTGAPWAAPVALKSDQASQEE
jgi:hypothetical protein